MKFKAWLVYPDMTISVQRFDGRYRCIRYKERATQRIDTRDCMNGPELKYYLLSFSNAPKREIKNLIDELD